MWCVCVWVYIYIYIYIYTYIYLYIYNGILLAIKKNKFESVLVRWVNLEPILQSEVSQEEKNKYCILTYTYGI